MNKLTFNLRYILAISIVSALGGLLFGYDWVVIGGAKPFYELFFHISSNPSMQGWAMSSALIGCLVGAALSGVLSDKYGRKWPLIFAAFLFSLSAVGTGIVNNFTLFVIYRLIGGVGIGLASTLSPMYIAEVAPTAMRGKFVSLNQLTIVLGMLGAQIANWQIAQPIPETFTNTDILNSWNGQMGWRYMFWAECIPAFIFFVLMFFVPESPRWLAKAGKDSKVLAILQRIGGLDYAQEESKNIHESLSGETHKTNWRELFRPGVKKVLLIGFILAVFQQWCGINVIFNYAQEIFAAAGYGVSDILFNIVITGVINVIFTFVAIYTVDRLGRRALLLIGSSSLAIIYILVGFTYFFHVTGWILSLLILLAIAAYAMSLAPVTWVVISEIFPNRIRGLAMAISTVGLWAASFLLTYTFPLLNKALGAYGTFWLYAVICIGGYFFIFKKFPETKGKSLEEIEKEILND